VANTVSFDEPIVTMSDLSVRLAERNGIGDGDDRSMRKVHFAIRDALRDLPTKSNWRYYDRDFFIRTSASVALEVTYVDSTKTATVTSGTIPTDAVYGELSWNGFRSTILSVTGPTIILDDAIGDDFTGTATWFRSTYPIPKVGTLRRILRAENRQEILSAGNNDIVAWNVAYNQPGTPIRYTLKHDTITGTTDLLLSPPPAERIQYIVSALVAPPYPTLTQVFGAATGNSAATTFTCADAKANWIGALVRAAPSAADKPDSLRYASFEWQALITNVSGTTVTVDTALPQAFASEPILVSSIIDIRLGPMQTYFEALCHEYFCRNYKHDGLAAAISISKQLYLEARGADSQIDHSTPLYSGPMWPWIMSDLQYAIVR
jgi:hypothetical protein